MYLLYLSNRLYISKGILFYCLSLASYVVILTEKQRLLQAFRTDFIIIYISFGFPLFFIASIYLFPAHCVFHEDEYVEDDIFLPYQYYLSLVYLNPIYSKRYQFNLLQTNPYSVIYYIQVVEGESC